MQQQRPGRAVAGSAARCLCTAAVGGLAWASTARPRLDTLQERPAGACVACVRAGPRLRQGLAGRDAVASAACCGFHSQRAACQACPALTQRPESTCSALLQRSVVWRSAHGQRAHLLCASLPLCFRVSAPAKDGVRGSLLGAVDRAPAAPEATLEAGTAAASADRVRRLGLLIRLRKLYRNLLRAEGLLAQAAPVYRPPLPLPGGPLPGRASVLAQSNRPPPPVCPPLP